MNNEYKGNVIPEITMKLTYDKRVPKSELLQVRSSADSYQILQQVFNPDTFDWKEEMVMLCLSRCNKVLGYYRVSTGGIAATICDAKVVFTVALNCGASSIIIAHNHPSGTLTPSQPDDHLTRKIKQAATYLDMNLMDHLILTDSGYYSYADNGTL